MLVMSPNEIAVTAAIHALIKLPRAAGGNLYHCASDEESLSFLVLRSG